MGDLEVGCGTSPYSRPTAQNKQTPHRLKFAFFFFFFFFFFLGPATLITRREDRRRHHHQKSPSHSTPDLVAAPMASKTPVATTKRLTAVKRPLLLRPRSFVAGAAEEAGKE